MTNNRSGKEKGGVTCHGRQGERERGTRLVVQVNIITIAILSLSFRGTIYIIVIIIHPFSHVTYHPVMSLLLLSIVSIIFFHILLFFLMFLLSGPFHMRGV